MCVDYGYMLFEEGEGKGLKCDTKDSRQQWKQMACEWIGGTEEPKERRHPSIK